MSGFKRATRKRVKLKLAITGPTGAGKTYSALRLATGLADGKPIAFIDTENGSASLYSDRFAFDVMDMSAPFSHEKFIASIADAVKAGYGVVVIDSFSHAWEEILNYKSKLDQRGGNSYTNWGEAGNKFKGILDAVLQSDIHVICCLRSKMEYVQEKDDRGKTTVRKVGLAPIMRDGISFEFTTVWDCDQAHHAQPSKDRTGLFGDRIEQITEDHGARLLTWLASGAAPATVEPPVAAGQSGPQAASAPVAGDLGNSELAQEVTSKINAQMTTDHKAEARALYDQLKAKDAKRAESIRASAKGDYLAMKTALQEALKEAA